MWTMALVLAWVSPTSVAFEGASAGTMEAERAARGMQRNHLGRAWLLIRMGRTKEALAVLDEASLRDHPDALLLGAEVCHAMGAGEEAVRRLARALHVAPLLLIEIDGDPELLPLVESDGAREVVLDARRRLEQ